jgi:uncharacterized membrane protein
MKPVAWVLVIGVQLLASVALAGKLAVFCHGLGYDTGNSPEAITFYGQLADVALALLAMLLGMMFLAVLNSHVKTRQSLKEEDAEDETRVVVKTPMTCDHKVAAKVVVTNNPRRIRDDSSEFELTIH